MTAILVKPSLACVPTCHHLDNGLTIIAQEMPVEAVNLSIWLKVGSIVEPDNLNGMAHFLEHMVFKGTPHLKSGDFERLVEGRGAVTNAATSQEYTHYYLTCAPDDFSSLAPLQLDIVFNPSLEEEAFTQEKAVICEEIRRSEDSPRRRTFAKAMQTCFQTLPYRRPILGTEAIISALQVQQMGEFHRQWYQPSNSIVVVVGNKPIQEIITTVSNCFSPTPAGCLPSLDHLCSEPPFREIVRQEYTESHLQQTRLLLLWKVPGLKNLLSSYALDVLAAVLGQGKVSRLFRQLREERGLVSQISTSNLSQSIQGVFSIAAHLSLDHVDAVEQAIIEEIDRIRQDSISVNELERLKTQVANRFIFGNERPSDRAGLYGYYYSQLGDLQPALTYPEIIQSLTLEDIQQAAQEYLSSQAYGVVLVKPAT